MIKASRTLNMLRTVAPRVAGCTGAGSGGGVVAAVPRLPLSQYAAFRRMHGMPAAAMAASSILRGDSLGRHAAMAPLR